jgi:hypothetical protein
MPSLANTIVFFSKLIIDQIERPHRVTVVAAWRIKERSRAVLDGQQRGGPIFSTSLQPC